MYGRLIFFMLGAMMTSPLCAETKLSYGFGGVRMQVGRVHMSVRSRGRVSTSIPVGNTWFHQSNYGMSGVSFDSPVGRIDSISNARKRRSLAWYTARPPSRVPNRIDWKLRNIRPDTPAWQYSQPNYGAMHVTNPRFFPYRR